MFNQQLITERLELIRSSVLRLRAITGMSLEDFQGNEDAQDIAENRLRKALEALFDLGRHIAVKSGAGIPQDYRSVIAMLNEKDILPADFCQEIVGMAGYRNRLIHEYNKVTAPELYEILQLRLGDLELFCRYMVKFLERQL